VEIDKLIGVIKKVNPEIKPKMGKMNST